MDEELKEIRLLSQAEIIAAAKPQNGYRAWRDIGAAYSIQVVFPEFAVYMPIDNLMPKTIAVALKKTSEIIGTAIDSDGYKRKINNGR